MSTLFVKVGCQSWPPNFVNQLWRTKLKKYKISFGTNFARIRPAIFSKQNWGSVLIIKFCPRKGRALVRTISTHATVKYSVMQYSSLQYSLYGIVLSVATVAIQFRFAAIPHTCYCSTRQGSGNTYRGLLFLVFLGCGQLTGMQERSKTVIWYIPPTRVRFLRTRVRLR